LKSIMKIVPVILALSLTITLIGCEDKGIIARGELEEYDQIAEKVDLQIEKLALGASSSSLAKEFDKADDTKKAEIAMHLAADMAIAQTFDVITDDMLAMAGKAVKAFPHPLLLNNYAGMLADKGNAQDALFFYVEALNQEPNNPIFLTNIANMYIELDNYSAAKDYAHKALMTMDDYGPAYQVLTTLHLKDGNKELAAETMIKSTKLGFNELTIHQFDSFIDWVQSLTPGVDEYPLKKELLDELYTIARTYVDTLDVNGDIDTPDAQIKFKPFPTIGSANHLMRSEQYLTEENDKLQNKALEANDKGLALSAPYFNHLNRMPAREEEYPVLSNIRQIYAYRILDSYYNFKLIERYYKFSDINEKIHTIYTDQEAASRNNYGPAIDEARMSQDYEKAFQLEGQMEKEIFQYYKQYADSIIPEYQNLYKDTNQLLEEFWLKSGGLIKYFSDEDILDYFNAQREMTVFNYVGSPIKGLSDLAMLLNTRKLVVDVFQQGIEELEQIKGEDTMPDLGNPVIATYPDRKPLPVLPTLPFALGLEGGIFGFSGSMSTNLDSFDFGLDSFAGGVGGQSSASDPDMKKAYILYPIKAEANLGWFKDIKSVKKAFDTTGKLGKVMGLTSKIGIGYLDSEREGEYIVSKEGKGFIDRGSVRVQEKGWDLWQLGKSEKVEVFKSYETGVVEIKKSTKYKFFVATLTVDE